MTVALNVAFVASPPGLSPYTAFTLDPIDGADGLYALRSQDQDDVRLYVLDQTGGRSGYAPHVGGAVRAEIGAEDPADVRLFVVVNPTESGVFVNLRAPIIMHRESGRASQIILEDESYSFREPLTA